MKSSQDHISTHNLGNEMALDAHGRVLRKPHFVTMEEHEQQMQARDNAWSSVLMAERTKVQGSEAKYRTLLETKVTGVTIIYPQIIVRRRLRGLVRWLIRVK